jgi:hypothetical protein
LILGEVKVSGGLTFTAPILASLLLVSSLTVPWIEASITDENSLDMPDAYRCLLGCFMPYAETFGPLEHQLARAREDRMPGAWHRQVSQVTRWPGGTAGRWQVVRPGDQAELRPLVAE